MEWLDKVRQKIQPLPQSPYAQALNGGLDLEAGLRRNLNKPLMNAMPYQQFNPTLMQGKNLIAEVMPGIGDVKALSDAKDAAQSGHPWLSALNAASVVPGVGDLARLGGNALPMLGAMTAFHGSPHKFSQFDLSKIGTGEGAQAYGHGLYFAESPGVAKSYQNMSESFITKKMEDAGVSQNTADMVRNLLRNNFTDDSINRATEAVRQVAPADYAAMKSVSSELRGSLYEVDIPDSAIEKMLDWDKPLSEQPESVRKALEDGGVLNRLQDEINKALKRPSGHLTAEAFKETNMTGGDLYGANFMGATPKEASEYLNSLGIPGIKYFDGSSRASGEGTRNFVVFDDKIVKVLSRNGENVIDK